MNVELSQIELELIEMLLAQEESDINIEIHHSRNNDYTELLHKRQDMVHDTVEKLREAMIVRTS